MPGDSAGAATSKYRYGVPSEATFIPAPVDPALIEDIEVREPGPTPRNEYRLVSPAPPVDRVRYAVLDFETGGLDPANCALCSVGLVGLDAHLAEVERYHRRIADDPEKLYTPEAMAVNGLDPEALKAEGTPVAEVLGFLRAALPGKVVVCHNAAFDLAFLAARGIAVPEAVCTLELARLRWRGGRNRLADVAARLGAERGPAHDALGDVITTANVLRKLAALDAGALRPRPVRLAR